MTLAPAELGWLPVTQPRCHRVTRQDPAFPRGVQRKSRTFPFCPGAGKHRVPGLRHRGVPLAAPRVHNTHPAPRDWARAQPTSLSSNSAQVQASDRSIHAALEIQFLINSRCSAKK